MKKIMILAMLIGFYTAASCQQKPEKHFVRVFNVEGKKVAKGFIVNKTETILTVAHGSKTTEVPMSDVSKIKKGRSAGHYILIGSVAVIVPFTIAIAIAAASWELAGPLMFTFTP